MMHYYQFNVADYRKSTQYLTFLEHAIYRTLLDTYYLNESPLCGDDAKLMRLHGIRTEEEKAAFRVVIEDFFTLKDGHYHHEKCDQVLSKIYEKSEKARASAMKRWERNANASKTQSERNANGMLPNTQYPIPKEKDILSSSDDSPQKIVDQYNRIVTEIKPNWQRCTALTAKRKTMVKSALKLVEPRAKLIGETPAQYLERLLEAMASDADFFSGWPNQRNRDGFNCSFDTNFRQERIAQAIDKFAGQS